MRMVILLWLVALRIVIPKDEMSSDFNNFPVPRITAWMVGENIRVVNPQSHW